MSTRDLILNWLLKAIDARWQQSLLTLTPVEKKERKVREDSLTYCALELCTHAGFDYKQLCKEVGYTPQK